MYQQIATGASAFALKPQLKTCHSWRFWWFWGASLVAPLVKNLPAMQETWFSSWVRKILWRRHRLPTPVFLGFPGGSASKESSCNVGDLGSVPGLGRSPGEGNGYPLQYFGLENSMDYTGRRVGHNGVTFTFTWFYFFLFGLLKPPQFLYPVVAKGLVKYCLMRTPWRPYTPLFLSDDLLNGQTDIWNAFFMRYDLRRKPPTIT